MTKVNLLKDVNVPKGSVDSQIFQIKSKTSRPFRTILRPETALRPKKINKNLNGIIPPKLHQKNLN